MAQQQTAMRSWASSDYVEAEIDSADLLGPKHGSNSDHARAVQQRPLEAYSLPSEVQVHQGSRRTAIILGLTFVLWMLVGVINVLALYVYSHTGAYLVVVSVKYFK